MKPVNLASFRLIPLLAACLLAQGCVGVAVKSTQTKAFDSPSVKDKAVLDDGVRESIAGAPPDSGPYDRATCPPVGWLRDHWGEPASVRQVSTQSRDEIWTYRFGRVWCGIVPCVVVPIPIVLPVGQEEVTFSVRDGRVVSAEVVRASLSFTGAALFTPEGPFIGSFED
jgi:hypothetical protein